MKIKRHFYLMISCPSDVVNERKLLKDCVENINSERTDDIWIELQYWATDTSSDAGMLAQDSINEQIVKDSDGLIAIFNARLGTPVHQYKCGTDEEISLMLAAKKHVSLLFNTKPSIDLSNPNSIDQITKLQAYKEEQSKKAYYREFSDEESFLTLARREILLWLRTLTNNKAPTNNTAPTKNSSIETHEDVTKKEDDTDKIEDSFPEKETETTLESNCTDNTETSITENNAEYKTEILPIESNQIDTEAGILDCVVYITTASQELSNELNNFTRCSEELNEKTITFNDRIKMYQKQPNSHAGTLILYKQFANDINIYSEKSDLILSKIESKWNDIYQYLIIFNNNSLNYQDKIIVKDSVGSLKNIFIQSLPQLDDLIDTFSSLPNIQKDLKTSVHNMSEIYKHFKKFVLKAISNCDELETLSTQDNMT